MSVTLPLDERDAEPLTPMKRLGSTRKLVAFNNIKCQLSEQLRWLDARVEAQAALASELHDYFKRRAELENEYSKALEKLARTTTQRHKDQRHKREQWPLLSTYTCWQQMVGATKSLARDHAALADIYGGRLASRLQRASEDAIRLHRKCKEIAVERQEEVTRVLAEVGAACKNHAALSQEWRTAASKLRAANQQRERLAPSNAEQQRSTNNKKIKSLDKEIDKRRNKHNEARVRALRARAEYELCLEAANATLRRYYLDDISDIIDCTDLGFHSCVSRTLRTHNATDRSRAHALLASSDTLLACIEGLDSRVDKQRFLEAHRITFALPHRISYQGPPVEEEKVELEMEAGVSGDLDDGESALCAELASRCAHLEAAIRALRAEGSEACKTLRAAESELLAQVDIDECDVSSLFGRSEDGNSLSLALSSHEQHPDSLAVPALAASRRLEQEDYYLAKFREYVKSAGRLARLESKAASLRARLTGDNTNYSSLARIHQNKRSLVEGEVDYQIESFRRGQFAAPLEQHLLESRRDLPLVLTSCIRVIKEYGLRHQGIFRVSGSQVEIGALRAQFESGDDPLACVKDASDINSVAGLLKLYLRELRPPLLPPASFDTLMNIAGVEPAEAFVRCMRDFVHGLPRSSMLVLRYLFAFLSHLSEYSDENMMDAWNLAICWGPTLLPAPGGREQVHAQNCVNELVKRCIVHNREVFPQSGGPLYTRTTFEAGKCTEQVDAASYQIPLDDVIDGVKASSLMDTKVDFIDQNNHYTMRWRCGDDQAKSEHVQVGDAVGDDDVDESPTVGIDHIDDIDDIEQEPDVDEDDDDDNERSAKDDIDCVSSTGSVVGVTMSTGTGSGTDGGVAAPDLVQGLPSAEEAPPTPPVVDEMSDITETFLRHRDTLKKRPQKDPQSSSSSSSNSHNSKEEDVGGEARKVENGGGGASKPAVAAKPTLLRRPTPHPHHAHQSRPLLQHHHQLPPTTPPASPPPMQP